MASDSASRPFARPASDSTSAGVLVFDVAPSCTLVERPDGDGQPARGAGCEPATFGQGSVCYVRNGQSTPTSGGRGAVYGLPPQLYNEMSHPYGQPHADDSGRERNQVLHRLRLLKHWSPLAGHWHRAVASRADRLRAIWSHVQETPSPTDPLGVKGIGRHPRPPADDRACRARLPRAVRYHIPRHAADSAPDLGLDSRRARQRETVMPDIQSATWG